MFAATTAIQLPKKDFIYAFFINSIIVIIINTTIYVVIRF